MARYRKGRPAWAKCQICGDVSRARKANLSFIGRGGHELILRGETPEATRTLLLGAGRMGISSSGICSVGFTRTRLSKEMVALDFRPGPGD